RRWRTSTCSRCCSVTSCAAASPPCDNRKPEGTPAMSASTVTSPRGALLDRLGRLYATIGQLLDRVLGPPVEALARVYLGWIFFKAGWGRLNDWSSQEFLFDQIHPVPGLPASLAAVVTTAGELILPLFLWLGLGQRFAALGLFLMTAVIQFVVAQTPEGIE